MNSPTTRTRAETALGGLSRERAEQLLRTIGPNELPRAPRRHVARILLGVLREPMFLLLALAAAIYLSVGGIAEGALMAGFAALSILLVVVQEKRSENALEALRNLAAPTARVVRDGTELRIAARDVVPGDLLLLADGERVAADARVLQAEGLAVDESLLTGESVPVPKRAAFRGVDAERSGEAHVYASTLATSGRGVAEVLATGRDTEAGRIGASLTSIVVEPTLLQRSLAQLVRVFATIALLASVALVLLYGLGRGEWLQGTLAGIAFGMSMLPEEFPMVLFVFVALGARRLAHLHVLVRRTAVIEMLGACSTLCVDKTGTLTENCMRICTLESAGGALALSGDERAVAQPFARLVSRAARASAWRSNDPMDAAVHRLAASVGIATPRDEGLLEREYGLTADRPAVVRVWRIRDRRFEIAAKGAPEAIADLCGLAVAERARLMAAVERGAARGERVLAVASGLATIGSLPDDPREFRLTLCGLIAFADPLRSSAREAVKAARAAGISVVMMTGDHPATAQAIARQAGIVADGFPVSGGDLDHVDAAELRRLIGHTRVFARIRPDQKLRLVEAFKDAGEIVAMTGDGVNDAPALRAAHIGLAMGSRGTDVAREAAAIVLMEDDLRHLVAGVAMGRRIFDNLRKVAMYIAAIHVPVAGLAFLPVLFGLPPLLLPMHVVLIEMVIDPVCAIAFENEPAEPNLMRRPPRASRERLLGWRQLGLAFAQGAVLLAASLGVYVAALAGDAREGAARALAFVALTAGNFALARVAGTRGSALVSAFARGHRAFWIVAAVAVAVTTACMSVPVLQGLFRFERPPLALALLAGVVGVVAALAFDFAKVSPAVRRVLGETLFFR